MNTLSELEQEAYKQQNKLALDIFARLDFLEFKWHDDKNPANQHISLGENHE